MSTEAQLKGDSLRRQLEHSQRYVLENDLDLVEDIRDLAVSAYKGDNVEYGALGDFIAAVRQGHIERGSYLIVEAFDRLSRQPTRIALQLILELINSGIKVVTLANKQVYSSESYDTFQLITSIIEMSTAAEESAKKSQRVSQAWEAGRNQIDKKKLTSRGPAWLSYNASTKQFDPIQNRVKIVQRIFDEAIKGIGAFTIAKRLNEELVPTFGSSKRWQPSTVNFILTSSRVIGEFQLHREIAGVRVEEGKPIKGYFPSIISNDAYFAAQAARLERKTNGGGRKGKYVSNIFAKLIYCNYCGSRMLFEDKGEGPKGGTYLVCMSIPTGSDCVRTRWRYNDFEASFLAFVKQVDLGSIFSPEKSVTRRASLDAQIASIRGQYLMLKQKRDKVFELSLEEDMDSADIAIKLRKFNSLIIKKEKELEATQAELSELSNIAAAFYQGRDQIKDLVNRVKEKSDDNYKTRAQIANRLRSIIERIDVASVGQSRSNQRIAKFLEKILVDPTAEQALREKAAEVVDLHAGLIDDRQNLRFFSVKFKDGTVQVVWPSIDDPLQFERRIAPEYEIAGERIQVY